MGKLDGKVAFVTGAARGQGRSHAVRLAQEGADIIAIDLCADIATVPYPLGTPADLDETASLVKEAGRRVETFQADVRDINALRRAFESGLESFGRVDIILANAGIAPMGGDESDRVQVWKDVQDVNLTGVWNTVEVALPAMVDAGNGGSIVLTSSTAGLKGLSNKTVGGMSYAAAKHGVVGLMRGYARDLAEHSIRVNTVHPTGVATPMIMNEALGARLAQEPELAESLRNALPAEMIEPVDVSNAIAWLVTDEARFVTGLEFKVDAGFLIR